MVNLTLKQEAFCLAFIETGNASEAYRRAYNAENMKTDTIHRNAKALQSNNKIATRLNELRAEIRERHNLTVDDISRMLQEDRTFARDLEAPAAAISASMGLAKLHGFLTDKVDVTAGIKVIQATDKDERI